MPARPTITLTTDFGHRDWFVGVMKGVILSLAPEANLVDLTHGVPPGNIRAGAFALAAACNYFPDGTVHLVVVDPGVGSPRRAFAVQTDQHCFVGPDNGVLSWALRDRKVVAIHALENSRLFLPTVSATFHGRDVFAPVAGLLARGVPLRRFGRRLKNFRRLDWPAATHRGRRIRGEVLYVDGFGNAITNVTVQDLLKLKTRTIWVSTGTADRICTLAPYYQAVPVGQPVAVIGSAWLVEIAVNGGNASEQLGLAAGSRIALG